MMKKPRSILSPNATLVIVNSEPTYSLISGLLSLILMCYSLATGACQVVATDLRFSETIQIEEILVDVVVTNPDGSYVGDLTAEEFLVYENDELQPITFFESCADAAPALDLQQIDNFYQKEAFRFTPTSEKLALETERRTIVIFLHQAGGEVFDRLKGIKAAAAFIKSALQPNDQIAVVLDSGELELICNLTTDHQPLAAALDNCNPRFQVKSVTYKPEPESIAKIHLIKGMALRPSAWKSSGKGSLGSRLVRSITLVGRSMAHIPGRKYIILISSGFIAPGGKNYGAYALDRLEKELADRRIVIYAIDAAGLRAPTGDIREFMRGEFIRRGSLAQLAEAGGGVKQPSTNDLAKRFAAVKRDMNQFYVIGYRKPHPESEGFHAIRVEVKRPGTRVRARSGYYDERSEP